MFYVYRYKNSLTGTYGGIILRREKPDDYFRLIHDRAILFPDQAKQELENVTVWEHIGEFDELTGKISFCEQDQSAASLYDGAQAFEQLKALKSQIGESKDV